MDDKIIVGESNCNSVGRNYNKMVILSEVLKGNEVILMDDKGEEYKPLSDILGVSIENKSEKRIKI